MKYIKYHFKSGEAVFEKSIVWSEEAETIAAAEAVDGKYDIVDDGKPEQVTFNPDDAAAKIAAIEEQLAAYEQAYRQGVQEA